MIEFLVDSINEQGLIIGKSNADIDIPLGSAFSKILKAHYDNRIRNVETVELDNIHLVLMGVTWYRREIDFIPKGHSAGIVLEGTGLKLLSEIINNSKKREYVHIQA